MDYRDVLKYKEYFKGGLDRQKAKRLAILAVIPVLILILGYTAVYRYTTIRRGAALKAEDVKRFKALEQEYLVKKAAVDSISRKALADPGISTVSLLENIGSRIGVKNKITSINPVGETERLGYTEREFEIKIDGIDLNQLVNLLYQTENNTSLLVVREFSMKSRFENPDLLDISLKLSHITKQG
ncbi:MAG: hypothetical protein HYS21_05440 [Deltaproteobacteria bacterium]|nr:hypothetical protein [Deltaproteobacteria bacterium]